jgi:3-hydroxy-9,10-secoandrosta-1,3,5(10)-triene-9,17-dione monooxygenase reductase component
VSDLVEDPLGPEGFGAATFDQARFRSVLGHFATGVTVVAAVDGREPIGLSVNSFTSVSLDPPLVLFCAAKASTTWPRIRKVGAFAVNVLSESQEDVSRVFATRGADKFRGVGWSAAPSGSPILDGVLAWVDCSLEAEHEAGDHVLVVGRARDLGVADEGVPLIFYRGGYGRFEP